MAETIVTVPFYCTDQEGWQAATSVVAGSAVLLANIERHTANHFHVCSYDETVNSVEIKRLISEGMKAAHQKAQEHMVEVFGDDWKQRSDYHFGDLSYNQTAELTAAELEYLDS